MKGSFSKILIVSLILVGGAFGSYKLYNMVKGKPLSTRWHAKSGMLDKWVTFNPKDAAFSVLFPKNPEHLSRTLPVPRSDDTLPYNEYQASTDSMTVSVSYTVLPDDWVRWGSSLVLKGALKVIMGEIKGAHLVGKSSNTLKSYPALDFEHYLGDQETAGTLVLVGNVLYKVEISYPLSEREHVHDILGEFIESFCPQESAGK